MGIKETIMNAFGPKVPEADTTSTTREMVPLPANPAHVSPAMRLGRFLVNQQFILRHDGANEVCYINEEGGNELPILGVYFAGQMYHLTARNRAAVLEAQRRGLCAVTVALPTEGLQLTQREG